VGQIANSFGTHSVQCVIRPTGTRMAIFACRRCCPWYSCGADRLIPENAERRLHCRITSSTTPLRVNHMTKVELSLHLEANYPATAKSIANRKPVYGVGMNDAHYTTTPVVNGATLRDPAYDAWASMMNRTYSPKFHEKHPTYSDVTVCKEWHSFCAFREWWLNNHREDFQLDKDLLSPGNREYSPDACIYVPRWLNSFLNGHEASRGELPIGVSFCKQTGRYRSQCCNPITGKHHKLGRFTTPEEASEAWLDFKLSIADRLKKEMDRIDKRIYNNVLAIIIVNALT
jgi:hypothetical protein